MHRNIIRTGLILMGSLFFGSCVSMKKYRALEADQQSCTDAKTACLSQNADLRQQNTQMQQDYNTLEAEKNLLAAQSSDSLYNKQKELEAKESALNEREKVIDNLRAKLNATNQILNNLRQDVSNALVGYKPEDLSVEIHNGKVYVSLSDKLLFPSGSDKVDKNGAEALQKLATVLANAQDTSLTIEIEGHTDSIPIHTARFSDNWDLSVHRATSIIRILTDNGVNPEQLVASGRGEYYPVATNATPEGRQQNRRTEIILSPKLDALWKILY